MLCWKCSIVSSKLTIYSLRVIYNIPVISAPTLNHFNMIHEVQELSEVCTTWTAY